MEFQPKTDWKYDDTPTEADFNRIEQGIADALEGNDPIIQQDTPPDGVKEGRLWLDTSDDTYQGTVFESLKGEIAGHLAEKATTTGYGHTILNPTTTSTSNEEAATAGALKQVMDEAKKKLPLTGGSLGGSLYSDVPNNGERQIGFKDLVGGALAYLYRQYPSKKTGFYDSAIGTIWEYDTTGKFYIKGYEALHAGNLASLGVGKSQVGTFTRAGTPIGPLQTLKVNIPLNFSGYTRGIMHISIGTRSHGTIFITNAKGTARIIRGPNVGTYGVGDYYRAYPTELLGYYDEVGANGDPNICIRDIYIEGSNIVFEYFNKDSAATRNDNGIKACYWEVSQ